VKRVGGLFDAIHDRRTLAAAFHRCALGRRATPEVRRFAASLDQNLAQLSRDIRAGNMVFGPYREFWVRDTKLRRICAPPFRQRLVHQAILLATRETFEHGALPHSMACRIGRGQHLALRRARQHAARHSWVLKMDIRRYYDSISHELLRRLLVRRFRERRLLRLFDAVIDSYQVTPGCGIPIGALTSQYFANFLLDSWDHHAVETLGFHRYLRYMDDMVVWSEKKALLRLRDEAVAWFAQRDLAIKCGGQLIRSEQGLPFLGFVVYPDRLRSHRSARRRLGRRHRTLLRKHRRGWIDEAELQARSTALFAAVRHGDDVNWRRALVVRQGANDPLWGCGPRPEPRHTRRLLGQHRHEVPFRVSQQEPSHEREPQPGLPSGLGPQRDDPDGSPDNPHSRSPRPRGGETTVSDHEARRPASAATPSPFADIQPPTEPERPTGAPEKARGDTFSENGEPSL